MGLLLKAGWNMQAQPLVTKDQIEAERLRSLARVFQAADRTLTGEDVTCVVDTHGNIQAPAFSNGKDITLNLPYIGKVDDTDDIIKVTGLNYHELSHVMFSPRSATDFSRECRHNYWTQTANVLEDQRIETLLTSMYPSTAPYFVNVVMNYCVSNPQDWPTAYALLYGRKYLPQAVRDQFKARFEKPELLGDLERIIDRYRTIAFPTDTQLALQLVGELHALMLKLQHPAPSDPFGHSTNTRPEIQKGKPMGGNDQEAAAEWVDYRDEERDDTGNSYDPKDSDDQDDTEDDDQDDSGDSPDDTDGEGTDFGADSDADEDDGADGSDEAAGDGQGDDEADYGVDAGDDFGDSQIGSGDQDGDTGDDAGEDVGGSGDGDSVQGDDDGGEAQDGFGNGAGTGGGDIPQPTSDNDFEDMMNEVADLASNLPEVQEDAKQKEKAARNGMGGIPNVALQDFEEKTVLPAFSFASRRFERELLTLWVDSDPGYHKHKASGRINMGRAMRGEALDTIWDQWDEGKTEATDIEMVVLFDVSGSMNNVMHSSSQILWAIKKAVEKIGGDVTVISFSDNAQLMYGKQDKIHGTSFREFGTIGGTDPSQAITEAAMIFHGSKRHHKIALFITDGEWNSGGGDSNHKIANWNANGIITACAYLDTSFSHRYYGNQPVDLATMTPAQIAAKFHNCSTVAAVDNPDELVPLAKGIVKKAMTAL